ncbi:MAG: polysaccharide biosynthesis protein, partial [Streptococcus salivarius]
MLFFYLWKEGKLKSLFGKQAVHPDINPTAIVIETFKEAIPFIITGSAIQLFQLIDQWTFIRTMERFTSYSNSQLQVLYAYLSSNPSKITMILIAVALSIAGVGIPLLTENMVKKDLKGAAKLIINNLQLLLLFIVPAIAGSVVLAKPLYTVFYGAPDSQAHLLFVASLIQVIFLAL